MSLAKFATDDKSLALLQTSWASAIDPVIDNPIAKGIILNDIKLVSGDNVVNHRLGRKLQGWIIIGQTAAAQFYDKQSTNNMTNLTLVLNSSATVTTQLYVF